jgi:transcription-repair coupling factor (superfamily II helicase)
LTLATHDLESRGAGELLGAEQSGQINQVGFSLYSDMLARAVTALQNGQEPELDAPLRQGLEIEMHVPALIPETYLADVQARLTLYKRIASARDGDRLRELQVEMIDRFGLLPEPVKNLFAIAELKLLAERIGVDRIDWGPQGGRVEFREQARAAPEALILAYGRTAYPAHPAGLRERRRSLRGRTPADRSVTATLRFYFNGL